MQETGDNVVSEPLYSYSVQGICWIYRRRYNIIPGTWYWYVITTTTGRKYKDRFVSILISKLSLFFRSELVEIPGTTTYQIRSKYNYTILLFIILIIGILMDSSKYFCRIEALLV